ncbi:MAG: hypothetical protein ACFE9Z_08495 [Promethearchaeota archaeon]
MDCMDKYKRLMLALILIAVISSGIYFIAIIGGVINSEFPYGIFLPSWAIILIPIITRSRSEEKRKGRS